MESRTSLNPNESLQIITDTIAKTRSNIRQNSFFFLLWGWLVSLASILQYSLITFTSTDLHFLPWPILMIGGAIISGVYGYRMSKLNPTESYVNNFMKNLWIVLGISFFIMVFLCLKMEVYPTPFALLLAGVGTLISGLVMKFNPLTIGGAVFLLAAVVAVFFGGAEQLIINAVAIVLGYLIPAYLLKNAQ